MSRKQDQEKHKARRGKSLRRAATLYDGMTKLANGPWMVVNAAIKWRLQAEGSKAITLFENWHWT